MDQAGQGVAACLRNDLRAFAQHLDDITRAEVLAAIEPVSDPAPIPGQPASALQIGELSSMLLRLSGLITSQQARLLGLLNELQCAMQHQDVLQSLREELAVARRLQQSILPREPLQVAGVQLHALTEPASEVGGDFFDYFMLDDHRLALVVGDVAGKGIPAAFFMAITRTLLRVHALTWQDPRRVIAALNDQLCVDNDAAMFVTLVFGILDLAEGRLDAINAGHPAPLLMSGSASPRPWLLPRHPALGAQPGLAFVSGSLRLAANDLCLVYTDGILEARSPQGEEFGLDRLIKAMAGPAPELGNLPEQLLARVRRFEAGAPVSDDLTCLALQWGHGVISSGSHPSTRR